MYYGKYKAKVVDIKDPEKRGRVRVICPKVLGESKSSWCETCVPVASDKDGDFCLPKVGESVWIEFEDGNQNKPILVGSWYSKDKSPMKNYANAHTERIISFLSNVIHFFSDKITIFAPREVRISNKNGSNVVINGDNITLYRSNANVVVTNNLAEMKKNKTTVKVTENNIILIIGSKSLNLNEAKLEKLIKMLE